MAAPRYGGRLKRAVTFHAPLTLMVGVTLFPFYWMVITSIRPDAELYNVESNPFFTLHPTIKHFQELFALYESEAKRLKEWIDDTVRAGAKVLCGGRCEGVMLEATLLENVPKELPLCAEEAFGPVAMLEPFSDFDAALDAVHGHAGDVGDAP